MSRLNSNIAPSVMIDRVDIKRETASLIVDNPHIADEGASMTTTDIYGNVTFVKSGIGVFSTFEEQTVLKVNISILGDSWTKDVELLKYLRLQILQSRDKKVTDAISKRKISFISAEYSKQESVRTQDYNITSLLKEDGTVQKNFTFTFTLSGKVQEHVVYFANCFVDTESLKSDFGLNLLPAKQNEMVGPKATKTVYENGRLSKTRKVLFDSSGRPYKGPTTKNSKGQVISGEKVNDTVIANDMAVLLTSWDVKDTKTTAGVYYQDLNRAFAKGEDLLAETQKLINNWSARSGTAGTYYSDLKSVVDHYNKAATNEKVLTQATYKDINVNSDDASSIITYDFLCAENKKPSDKTIGTENFIDKYVEDKLGNGKYFTDAMITTNEPPKTNSGFGSGAARIIFSIDYTNLFKNNISYPCLLDTGNTIITNEVLKYIKIKYIEITRNRTDVKQEIFEHVVTGGGDVVFGTKKSKEGKITGTIQEIDGASIGISSISEVESSGAKSEITPAYRTFAVEDKTVEGMRNGTFSYTVTIGLEDKTEDFVKDRLESLTCGKDIVDRYYGAAQLKCSYDSASDSFTSPFIEKQYSSYTNRDSPWIVGPTVYADVLRCFAMITDIIAYALAEAMYKKLDPLTSNPDKILSVLKDFEILDSEIRKQYDINVGTDNYSKGKAQSKSKKRTIEVENTFKTPLIIVSSGTTNLRYLK